jgi:hypothetical protein
LSPETRVAPGEGAEPHGCGGETNNPKQGQAHEDEK